MAYIHKVTNVESKALKIFFQFAAQTGTADWITSFCQESTLPHERAVEIRQGNPRMPMSQKVTVQFTDNTEYESWEPFQLIYSGLDSEGTPWRLVFEIGTDSKFNEVIAPADVDWNWYNLASEEERKAAFDNYFMKNDID